MLLYSKNVLFVYSSLLIFTIYAQDLMNGNRFYSGHKMHIRDDQNGQEVHEEPRVRKALRTAIGFGKRGDRFIMDKIRKAMPFSSRRLSTAINYGKRSDPLQTESYHQKIAEGESVPVEWLVDVLQNEPDLLKMFIRKFMDSNEDDEITANELSRLITGFSNILDSKNTDRR